MKTWNTLLRRSAGGTLYFKLWLKKQPLVVVTFIEGGSTPRLQFSAPGLLICSTALARSMTLVSHAAIWKQLMLYADRFVATFKLARGVRKVPLFKLSDFEPQAPAFSADDAFRHIYEFHRELHFAEVDTSFLT